MTTQTLNPVGMRRPRWAALREALQRCWRGLARRQWWLIGVSWAAAVALGCVGFYSYFAARGQQLTPWDILYLSLQLIPLQSGAVEAPVPVTLEVARFLAPAVSAWAVVRALALVFYERLRGLRLRNLHEHVVICGLGRKGLLLARGFAQAGLPVVAIELDGNSAVAEQAAAAGAMVLAGSAVNEALLRRARVQTAKYLIAVCGDDGVNAEVAVHASRIANGEGGQPLTCLVHIVDPRLCALLRERQQPLESSRPFKLAFFNTFDSGARALLDEFPPFADTPAERPPHLLVVGLGRMGENVVLHAARRWDRARGRLRITIIDREAETEAESLRLLYPELDEACTLVPETMEVRSPAFERATFLYDAAGRCSVTSVYVCFDNDPLCLWTGLALLHKLRQHGVPIVVRMADDVGLATLLQGVEGMAGFDSLRAFGLLSHTCRPDLLLQEIDAGMPPACGCPGQD